MEYIISGTSERKFVAAFPVDGDPLIAADTNPNYEHIVAILASADIESEGSQTLASLFTPANAVKERFERLSDRVTVRGGTLLFDGDAVDSACAEFIVRLLDEGDDADEDYLAWAQFVEKVNTNPSEQSREGLFTFLRKNQYTITEDGDIVAYKGLRQIEPLATNEPRFTSIHAGNAGDVEVNDVPAAERPIQGVGDTVTMARSKVDPSHYSTCSHGLHVAAWNYANGSAYGSSDVKVRVLVNPRDVVAVPTDYAASKMRVSRYVIDDVVKENDTSAVLATTAYIDDDDDYDE